MYLSDKFFSLIGIELPEAQCWHNHDSLQWDGEEGELGEQKGEDGEE